MLYRTAIFALPVTEADIKKLGPVISHYKAVCLVDPDCLLMIVAHLSINPVTFIKCATVILAHECAGVAYWHVLAPLHILEVACQG